MSLASKGLVSMDIRVEGAATDLHSGRYGGTVANPLHALAEILAGLHTPDGGVAVAGFYDGIPPLTAERRAQIAAIDFDETRLPGRARPAPRATASRGTPPWSGCGSGRPWRSTASPAAASTP